MRNPTIYKLVAKAIYDFKFKSGVAEKLQVIKPLDKQNLAIDQIITEWGTASLERIAKIRSKQPAESIIAALDELQNTYL